jgi:copper homeostasis protein
VRDIDPIRDRERSTPLAQPVLLEIAAASVEDALAAQSGGADRVELNAALTLGRLTPTLGLLAEIKTIVTLPVVAMVRPRAGGFAYSPAEFRVLRRDLDLMLEHEANGIATGVLTDAGEIDVARMREVVRAAGRAPVVMHRAFDLTPDASVALEQLIDLGVTRVMTSGQAARAHDGARCIAELIRKAAGRIEILPAGGINRTNVADLIARTSCTQVHCGLRTTRTDPSARGRPHIRFGSAQQPAEDQFDAVGSDAVAGMAKRLKETNHESHEFYE